MEISPTFKSFAHRVRPVNYWRAVLVFTAFLFSIPLFSIAVSLLQPFSETWQHLADTVLKDYVLNSLLLMFGVGVGTFVIGVTCAWVTSTYEFPCRKIFEWALLLPLAMPAYIIAYTYAGLFDFAGPVQSSLRSFFNWQYGDYWFPEIRSLGGAIAMLSLVLFPYVYLIVRASFIEQSKACIEASKTLGYGNTSTFVYVALPLARPAIVAGLSLAMMETLADYGTVQYFGISTFTTGIFRTWFGFGEIQTAAQLSSLLLFFVFTLIVLERWSRKSMHFHNSKSNNRAPTRIKPTKQGALLCFALCLLPVLFGFLLPALQLLIWAIETWRDTLDIDFIHLIGNSFLLAASASLICLFAALVMAYGTRLNSSYIEKSSVRIASMGYAIPGTVIAVGVLIPFALFDKSIDAWMTQYFNISTGLLLSGSLAALLFAYAVRFLSVSLQTVESGLGKIHIHIDESARSLGYRPIEVLRRIHFPLLRVSLLTALLLVFVDVLKELPATLILRPFNFNTLAVKTYELASDERLADASCAALAIVLIGLLPVIYLTHSINKKH